MTVLSNPIGIGGVGAIPLSESFSVVVGDVYLTKKEIFFQKKNLYIDSYCSIRKC